MDENHQDKIGSKLNRESRYFAVLLRGKNATRSTEHKMENALIRQARSSLIDPLTKERQIAIEGTIIEGT